MRNILIIGGNRGIGSDLVEKLTSDGDNIFSLLAVLHTRSTGGDGKLPP